MKKLLTFLVTLALVFTIAGCTNEPENTDDADNAADAAKKLSLDISDPLSVTSNIDFPTAGLHNATITWSTNNTAVIANDGTVTRPAIGANPVTVVITATVKVGKEEVSKDFTVKVLAAVPSSAMTIAQFIAAADDTVVELTGVVTGTIQGKGFHMADATGHTYIYLGVSTDYVLGDEVTVMGTKDTYYNIPELTFVTSNEKISSGNTLPAFVDTDIPTIYLEDNEDTDIYNTMIKLSGVVEIVGANNNVNLVWFDADMNKQYIEVYYKSGDVDKVAALRALEGKFVSVEAILMDYFSAGWWRISVNSNSTITELTLTDQQKADYAAAGLDLGNLSALDHSLQLDTTGDYSSTIAWASTNEAVIATDGTVTGATGTTEVTLTATVTVGTATATKTFTASVLDASALPLTVAQAKATAAGTVVNVTGVISGFAGMKPFIQDSDGTAMFVDSDIDAQVGDLVEISGEVFGFDDSGYTTLVAIELKDATLTKIVSSGNTVFVKTVTDVADIFTNFPGNAGERVTLTNVTILTLDDTHSHTIITSGTGEIKIYTPAFLVDGFFTNNIIPEMTFNIQHINFGDVKLEDVVFGALTDAQKMLIAKSMLVLPDSTTVNLELPTEFADYGATVVWASDMEAALAADGTVVRPEFADGDATATLTASVTVNGVTEDVDFTVTVSSKPGVAVPEVFFSEIIEGYSYNKAIELYNPTGADVDLSQYSIMENHGGYVLTTVLSGTLAAGDVYVICNDQLDAGTDLDTNCDIKLTGNPDVPNFNGNDTLQLLKNGIYIFNLYQS